MLFDKQKLILIHPFTEEQYQKTIARKTRASNPPLTKGIITDWNEQVFGIPLSPKYDLFIFVKEANDGWVEKAHPLGWRGIRLDYPDIEPITIFQNEQVLIDWCMTQAKNLTLFTLERNWAYRKNTDIDAWKALGNDHMDLLEGILGDKSYYLRDMMNLEIEQLWSTKFKPKASGKTLSFLS